MNAISCDRGVILNVKVYSVDEPIFGRISALGAVLNIRSKITVLHILFTVF